MGKRGPKSDKIWTDAVRRAVHREFEDEDGVRGKAIDIIARKVVKMAREGDAAAIKEIGDRLEGRPAQRVEALGGLTVRIIDACAPDPEEEG